MVDCERRPAYFRITAVNARLRSPANVKRDISRLLGRVETPHFTWAESNVNEA